MSPACTSPNQAVQQPPGLAVAGSQWSGRGHWSRPARLADVAIPDRFAGSAGRQGMIVGRNSETECSTLIPSQEMMAA